MLPSSLFEIEKLFIASYAV